MDFQRFALRRFLCLSTLFVLVDDSGVVVQRTTPPDELALFRTIVMDLRAASTLPLFVDVRIIVPNPASGLPELLRSSGVDADTAPRLSVLRELGVEAADALRAAACPGWMVVSEGLAPATPCAASQTRTAILSLSREGGARFPSGGPAFAAGIPVDAVLRTIRVVEVFSGPRGSAVESSDYVFGLRANRWQFLSRVQVYIVE